MRKFMEKPLIVGEPLINESETSSPDLWTFNSIRGGLVYIDHPFNGKTVCSSVCYIRRPDVFEYIPAHLIVFFAKLIKRFKEWKN